ncbi:MAG: DUF3575 domain-containing protein [Bacteroidetes bacterium]|nr:DUF3575 domain-containing protein [Bacteroidota bacterium]
MKKFSFLLLLLSVALMGQAQKKEKSESGGLPERKNCVKLNLTGLAFRNIGVQYERALGGKISVAAQIRFMPKGSLPLTNSIDNWASDSTNLYDIKVGSFAITPEFRFYPRHAMKGFYLAPYLRYRNLSMDAPVEYVDNQGLNQKLDMTGRLSSFGGGLMIGVHFNIGKMVSLDWFIIGAHYMASSGEFKANTSKALTPQEQADIREDLSNNQSDLFKYTYTVDANNVNVKGSFGAVGFRGMGLNIGFRF